MSVIFQDFAQYQLTVRENIRLGNVGLAETDPAIEAAARDAGAHEVITGLRHGYDTILGKWFDEGEELSVGEWQKIALARAFVRDAQILVFDEPTSALDPQAEWDVFQHIKELAPRAGRWCSSATASPRCARPTASTSSTRAASSRAAPTTNWWPWAAATRRCTRCRPGPTAGNRGGQVGGG